MSLSAQLRTHRVCATEHAGLEVLDEVQFLQTWGGAPAIICARLDVTPDAVARALYRVQRPEPARLFERLRLHRPGVCRFCGRPRSHSRRACRAHKELYRHERHLETLATA